MAVLLVFCVTLLYWLILAFQSFLIFAFWLNGLFLYLITEFFGFCLAVLFIAILLCFLGSCFHVKLADFLWLKVAFLLFSCEWKDVAESITVPTDIRLAHLNFYLSRDLVTLLLWLSFTDHLGSSVGVITFWRGLLLAIELYCIGARNVVNSLFLCIAIGSLNISALVIVFGGHINFMRGVAHTILPIVAPLYLVSLLQSLVSYGLFHVTH